MSIRGEIAKKVAPDVHKAAPGLNSAFIHRTVQLAVAGVGPLPGAAKAAQGELEDNDGIVDQAINGVVSTHTKLAGAQGFVANIGGIATAAAMIPANIAGLALLQCRMVAAVAHLRGYDLDDPRVRNAILLTTLGEDPVRNLVKRKVVPGGPMVLATAPTHDPELDAVVAGEVTSALVSRVIGKRAAGTVIRRLPLAGGVWSGSADAYATWQVGKYAARELKPRGQGALIGAPGRGTRA